MKHTKNYMDAMWVVGNPEKYDNRDVVRANSFIEAYNEGYNKALSLGTAVGQSEQLVCDECGDTGRAYPTLAEPDGVECEKCKASEQLVCSNYDGEGFSGKGSNEILPCLSCFGSGDRTD